jgi:hypothetical protein
VGQVAGVIYRTFTWGSYLNNGKAGLGWSVTLLVDLPGLSMNHSKAGGVSRSHSPKEASSCLTIPLAPKTSQDASQNLPVRGNRILFVAKMFCIHFVINTGA